MTVDVGDWRYRSLSDRLTRVEQTKPEATAQRLEDLAADVRWLRRLVVGVLLTAIPTLVATIIMLARTGGTP